MNVATEISAVAEGQDEQDFPPPVYAWYVVATIFFSGSFAFVDRVIVSLITPALQADLGFSDSQLGLLQGIAFALFYTLFGIPLGIVADRWNRKWLMTIGIAVYSVMTAACGLGRGFVSLFSTRLGVGMGEASMNPCVTSLISDYFPPRNRPRAISFYVMGQGVGQALVYILGGFLLGWLSQRGGLDLPVLGHFKPWQGMFVIIGSAGLIPAVLVGLTVREPKRREIADKSRARASAAQIRAFMFKNRYTLICHHLGVALTVMTAYGFSNWMPTFFLRTYGWTPQHFSAVYGSIVPISAITAPITAGWAAGWLRGRGVVDATWRLAIAGSFGCTIFAALAPLMPVPGISIAFYIIAGFFASTPAVLAIVAITEFVPNEMRGVISGVYFLIIGLMATGLGPFAVGFATDHLFRNRAAIGNSLALVSGVMGLPGGFLLALGLRSFRESIRRAAWTTPPMATRASS